MEGKPEDSEGPLPLGVTLNGGIPPQKINPAVQGKITTEADFYSFLDQCRNKNICGVKDQLQELDQYEISPEMKEKVVEYYKDDARNNKFDLEALEKFKKAASLDPDSWFSEKTFVPYLCAQDYLRVFPHVVSEYLGTMHQFTGKYYLQDAEGTIRTNIEKAGTGIVKPRSISEAIESLRNLTRIVEPDKIKLPMERIMPLPEHTIPIEDGLLNLMTKTISPHSPDYYYTECLPRHYIPGAVPAVFSAFLDKLFTGDPNAPLKKTQIFEIIAWTLTNNYDLQGAVILYGQGGEGKSIIHSVIADLLVNTTSLTLAELETDKFKRAELYGSWANLISESSSEIITSEWFKRLTDGTVITVDRKNGHPFKMASRAKLILDVNELPNKDNELRAFYRRVIAIIDFPNLLESILTPVEISDFVAKMKEPDELDRIFSYVVDNFYGPLVSRMKFTGQLSLAEAEKKWEERSNPAKSYLKFKNEAGDIITDVDTVRELFDGNEREISHYISRESNGEEYLAIVKADVVADAVRWATERGFPAKTITGSTIGSALVSLGYSNKTVNKKVSKGTVLKAWRDIYIRLNSDPVAEEVAVQKTPRYHSGTQSTPDGDSFGSGSYPLFGCKSQNQNGGEGRGASATDTDSALENSGKNGGSGHFGQPLPEPLPPDHAYGTEPAADPTKSDVPKQNPLHAMVLDILTRLTSLTGNTRIDPQEIMDAWPSTARIPCPGWNELTSRILPTMAGEGLLRLSNGTVEVPQ